MTPEERNLEHNLFTKDRYKLTEDDVFSCLHRNHIRKYKKF